MIGLPWYLLCGLGVGVGVWYGLNLVRPLYSIHDLNVKFAIYVIFYHISNDRVAGPPVG